MTDIRASIGAEHAHEKQPPEIIDGQPWSWTTCFKNGELRVECLLPPREDGDERADVDRCLPGYAYRYVFYR